MALNINDKISVLTIHRENLEKARDFEEYRKLHIAYIDFLIDDLMATQQAWEAVNKFANFKTSEVKE